MSHQPLPRPKGPIHPSAVLVQTIEDRLSWLSYYGLALFVQRLLISQGYEQVSILSRTFLKGRTNHGGIDMVAKLRSPSKSLQSVVIQLKLSETPVPRQAIQQFFGALHTYQATLGLSITTGSFAAPAIENAAAFTGQPIQLIDGHQLARMMVDARVGVRDVMDPKTGQHSLEFVPELFEASDNLANARRRGISFDIWGGY